MSICNGRGPGDADPGAGRKLGTGFSSSDNLDMAHDSGLDLKLKLCLNRDGHDEVKLNS